MDFRSLQHAIALADEGSFVKAAEKVSLTQSAVSRSILALERELGVALFDRTPSGVRPTQAGRALVERARAIVADARSLKADISRSVDDVSGAIAFGTGPALAVMCLPRLLAYCVDVFPRLRVTAEIDALDRLHDMLRRESIEFFLAGREVMSQPAPELALAPLGSMGQSGVFCRSAHPLAGRAAMTGDDLRAYPLALAGLGDAPERAYRALMQLGEQTPLDVRVVCDNLFVLQRVAMTTDALLVTSRGATEDLVAAGDLVELPIQPPAWQFAAGEVVAVSLKRRKPTAAATHLLERLRETLPAAD